MASRNMLMAFFLISYVSAHEVRRELTTRSWDTIGFPENVKHSLLEENIIIGVVDTGIWPEAPCFSDKGLGPPPAKWKGICQPNNFNFTCNNKIIGARYYLPDFSDEFDYITHDEVSPRDMEGHGTHVAATAAGVPVRGVSVKGIGLGTARGAMPRARIAVYKTCWVDKQGQCFHVDRAIDDAVKDGVDIISISIGRVFAEPYHSDLSAIASFEAMRRGVLVSFAAGNSGPEPTLMDNVAPWLLTVANGHAGPDIATPIKLGNGKTIKGHIMQKIGHNTLYPLVPSWEVSKFRNDSIKCRKCMPDSLDQELIKGKIVLCPSIGGILDFKQSTAAGYIFDSEKFYGVFRESYNSGEIININLTAITSEDFAYLVRYYNDSKSSSNGTATASILKTTEMVNDSPPTAAFSSSRGPNLIDPTILKPDITAPGVNIISTVDGNSTFGSYDSYTGTSMATPHASGIAGYVKSFNPSWSPAAIKSALLTTATPMATDKNYPVYELAYGAGMLNPLGAIDPGLVYDINVDDYLKYLCQWAENSTYQVQKVTRNLNFSCSTIKMEPNWSLNLPTFSIPAKANTSVVKVFNRKVKNVGSPISNYKAVVSAPKGVEIRLQPSVLSFRRLNQELTYTVTIKGQIPKNTTVLSASFAWTDGYHQVRSPIVIYPEIDGKDMSKTQSNMDIKEEMNAGGSHLRLV